MLCYSNGTDKNVFSIVKIKTVYYNYAACQTGLLAELDAVS